MKRVLLAALAALAALPATAEACSCVPPGNPKQELAEADAAVFGKVVKRRVVGKRRFDPTVRYRVKVLRDFKDNLGSHFSFKSTASSAACGVSFRKGERFGTLLYRHRGAWSVNLCTLRSRGHLCSAKR